MIRPATAADLGTVEEIVQAACEPCTCAKCWTDGGP